MQIVLTGMISQSLYLTFTISFYLLIITLYNYSNAIKINFIKPSSFIFSDMTRVCRMINERSIQDN